MYTSVRKLGKNLVPMKSVIWIIPSSSPSKKLNFSKVYDQEKRKGIRSRRFTFDYVILIVF